MPKKAKQKTKINTEKKTIWDIFKFGESYTSLILGIAVVIIATILLLTFAKGKNISTKSEIAKNTNQEQNTLATTQTQNLLTSEQKKPTIPAVTKQDAISGSTYTVIQGDTLWDIAEKKYNSGYNWIDIQKANNLTNPDVLFAGTKLTLPNVEPKIATQSRTSIQTNKISGSGYTIVKGDTLWDIAVRAYGDGYAWTKISRANNLPNPDLIYSGNKLSIPRG